MDKVIFGDNQFFGVNHRSESKAGVQLEQFKSVDDIYKTLDYVNEIGIKSFMFTTHEQFEEVFKKIAINSSFSDFKLIPCIPYAHKYANAMVDLGIFQAVKKFVPGNKAVAAGKVAASAFTANPIPLMKMLVDSEMQLLRKNRIEAIFLQNIVTDLLLGLGADFIFAEFASYVEKKYKIKVGFITMNHVKLVKTLVDKCGLDKPLICSSINQIGFRMNPGQKEVEQELLTGRTSNIAMSVLASGAIKPETAIKYIGSLDNVESVLFGASSQKNIIKTKELIEQYL